MASTLKKQIKYWFELERVGARFEFDPLDLNRPTTWIWTHFISSFSFLAFAFHLYLGDKSFGPENLQMDVCMCAVLNNTLWFWRINYLHDFFSAFSPIILGTVQDEVEKTVISSEVIKIQIMFMSDSQASYYCTVSSLHQLRHSTCS